MKMKLSHVIHAMGGWIYAVIQASPDTSTRRWSKAWLTDNLYVTTANRLQCRLNAVGRLMLFGASGWQYQTVTGSQCDRGELLHEGWRYPNVRSWVVLCKCFLPSPDELEESALEDPEPVNVIIQDVPVTYEEVDGATSKGGKMLLDNLGYGFTQKVRIHTSTPTQLNLVWSIGWRLLSRCVYNVTYIICQKNCQSDTKYPHQICGNFSILVIEFLAVRHGNNIWTPWWVDICGIKCGYILTRRYMFGYFMSYLKDNIENWFWKLNQNTNI